MFFFQRAVVWYGECECWADVHVFSAQVGDGTTTNRFTPVVVSGVSSGNVALAVGDVSKMFSCDCCVTIVSTRGIVTRGCGSAGSLLCAFELSHGLLLGAERSWPGFVCCIL